MHLQSTLTKFICFKENKNLNIKKGAGKIKQIKGKLVWAINIGRSSKKVDVDTVYPATIRLKIKIGGERLTNLIPKN